jgi:hypothetical protein
VPKTASTGRSIISFEEAVKPHFDNSANNKFNPAPDHELAWGEQSWHEM